MLTVCIDTGNEFMAVGAIKMNKFQEATRFNSELLKQAFPLFYYFFLLLLFYFLTLIPSTYAFQG